MRSPCCMPKGASFSVGSFFPLPPLPPLLPLPPLPSRRPPFPAGAVPAEAPAAEAPSCSGTHVLRPGWYRASRRSAATVPGRVRPERASWCLRSARVGLEPLAGWPHSAAACALKLNKKSCIGHSGAFTPLTRRMPSGAPPAASTAAAARAACVSVSIGSLHAGTLIARAWAESPAASTSALASAARSSRMRIRSRSAPLFGYRRCTYSTHADATVSSASGSGSASTSTA
mmetsp:Transcript_17998/g.67917  ORF Transcript_17998/g.67917 Transcript_17998/m.67917 type:complete len:230 (+) Transcript_17998:44-733(+)